MFKRQLVLWLAIQQVYSLNGRRQQISLAKDRNNLRRTDERKETNQPKQDEAGELQELPTGLLDEEDTTEEKDRKQRRQTRVEKANQAGQRLKDLQELPTGLLDEEDTPGENTESNAANQEANQEAGQRLKDPQQGEADKKQKKPAGITQSTSPEQEDSEDWALGDLASWPWWLYLIFVVGAILLVTIVIVVFMCCRSSVEA